MNIKDAFFLGLIQGIAEWLPISSSGHLAIFHNIYGLKGNISFDIFLHISSLFVIIIFFQKDIRELLNVILKRDFDSYNFKLILYISYATVITGIIGFLLRQYIEGITKEYLPYTYLFTSFLLFLSARKRVQQKIDIKRALFIGFMQSVALLPGISRSGATISAAKITGVEEGEAFRFSFLLAIPAILGAVVLEIKEFERIPLQILIAGFFTSFFVGFVSLWFLKRIVSKDKIYMFGFYTLVVAIVLFIL
ncbi:MAG: undecaprenyl-diphosphate phosphatase [bacterium]|nr:undecaprenyl-diphosphate phosphatase [bacterium]